MLYSGEVKFTFTDFYANNQEELWEAIEKAMPFWAEELDFELTEIASRKEADDE